MEKLMKIIDREVDARERSATSRTPNLPPKKPLPRDLPLPLLLWLAILDRFTVSSVSKGTNQTRAPL